MNNNELYHYGVLGMKWGVRRYQNKNGSLTSAGKKRRKMGDNNVHEDYKKAHNSKNVKSMSDAELRNRLNRLQMERQYSQLSPSKVNKGKQYFNTALKVGTTVATITTTGLTIYNNADKIMGIVNKVIKK